MRTNNRKYSRIILCVLLVAMFIVASFALVACNKKKTDGTSTGTTTTTPPVTGQTALNLDDVHVQNSITLATSYEDVTIPERYQSTGAYLIAPNGLLIYVVLDTESTDTLGNVYYLYDVFNKKLASEISFALFDNNGLMSYAGGAIYYFKVAHKNDTSGACSAYSIDLYGNIMRVYTGPITTTYQLQTLSALTPTFRTNNNRPFEDATFGKYIIVLYQTVDASTEYKVSVEDYSREEYEGENLPTFGVNDKYAERTAVPGLSGYYYFESIATNQILFYNRYNSTTAVSVLSLDFGLSRVSHKVIANGKVFLLTEGQVPSDETDYDYVETIGPLESKLQNRFWVFDIPTGTMSRLFAGYIIADNFQVFTANNNKPYLSIKAQAIQNYYVCRSYMNYVADTDGNFLVSTPGLFDVDKVLLTIINNNQRYYGYSVDGHVYLLDQNLNTLTTVDNVIESGNNFLVALDNVASQYYVFDMNKNIKVASLTKDNVKTLEVFGDYVCVEEDTGDWVVYDLRNEATLTSPTVIYEKSNSVFCEYIGKGIFKISQTNGIGKQTYKYVNARNTELLVVDNVQAEYVPATSEYNDSVVIALNIYDPVGDTYLDKLYTI